MYDSSRRLTKAIEVDTNSVAADLETWFQYRRDSRLERRRSARGFFTDFEYDAARRLEKVIDSLGNEVSFELDANGNREKVFSTEKVTGSPDEVYEARFVYDALDRVTERRVLDRITSAVEQVWTYDYDLRPNLTEVVDPNPNALLREALSSPSARFLLNDAGSFKVVADLGRAIGTKGQTGIKAVVDFAGNVITWFPVRP